jgi:2,4-dienoyl-CoA reductase-like NADH-dependent reductase (Old Yellow Enzyme family)/thioredoxin reductase
METNMPSITGEVNDRLIRYYEERAAGGVGAIIVEFTCVDAPVGRGTQTQLVLDQNGYIAGHTYLAEAIHRHDCKAFLQLHHAGRQTARSITGMQPVAPSPIACKVMKAVPRELTAEEVGEIVAKFVRAARRARLAGYDGVELHAAHGYLLNSFLSPYTNKRTDVYGGTTENRTRIIGEIIAGIKQKVDPDFPVIVRFSVDEFVEGGLKIAESVQIAKWLEHYGAAAIHVSTGIFETNEKNVDPMSAPQGWRIALAEQIKRAVNIPVIGVGVIREPEAANAYIKEGRVDLIALGRALLADPEWPKKAFQGKADVINRCTSCGYCVERLTNHQSVRCAVNPRAGRELSLMPLQPVSSPAKKVHVIGGGAAGLYAAILAAERGFRVVLYEKEPEPGGLIDVASAAPGKEKWLWFKAYLLNRVRQLGNIEVRCNVTVTPADAASMAGDYVIDATGMLPNENDQFYGAGIPVFDATEVLSRKMAITGKKAAVLGSRGAGLEVAHYLASQGNEVIIISRSDKKANGLNIDGINRRDILRQLAEHQVKIFNLSDIRFNDTGQLEIVDLKSNGTAIYPADILVLARGFHPNPILVGTDEAVKIGGSASVGKILDGVLQAYIAVGKLA